MSSEGAGRGRGRGECRVDSLQTVWLFKAVSERRAKERLRRESQSPPAGFHEFLLLEHRKRGYRSQRGERPLARTVRRSTTKPARQPGRS